MAYQLHTFIYCIYSEWIGVPILCLWATSRILCFRLSWFLNFFTHYFLSSHLISNVNECLFWKEVRLKFADWLSSLLTSVKPHCWKSLHPSGSQSVGQDTFCLLEAHTLSIQVEGHVDGWWWEGYKQILSTRQRISDWESLISEIILSSYFCSYFILLSFPLYLQSEYVKEPQ